MEWPAPGPARYHGCRDCLNELQQPAKTGLPKQDGAAIWPVFEPVRSLRLSVRTPGFQPGKRGSIPLGTAIQPHINKNNVLRPLLGLCFRRLSHISAPGSGMGRSRICVTALRAFSTCKMGLVGAGGSAVHDTTNEWRSKIGRQHLSRENRALYLTRRARAVKPPHTPFGEEELLVSITRRPRDVTSPFLF